MKTLLIITYDFPPSLAGVRRILKWIRYLPEFGWTCSVLTVKRVRSIHEDPSPLPWLMKMNVPVFRCGSLDPFRLAEKFSPGKKGREKEPISNRSGSKTLMNFLRHWIFIPDDRCGWIPFAALKGLGLVRKIKPDAILTTCYPHSTHLVGLFLKRFTGIPWLADFRDAWTQNPVFYKPPTPIHGFLQKHLEKSVARRCDILLTVSEPITDHFRRLLPRGKGKMHTLTNGYDEEDFASLEPHPAEKFTLVYTGTLYGNPAPLFFIEALRSLLDEHPAWRDDFDIRFYGSVEQSLMEKITKSGLEKNVHVEGFRSYGESLRCQVDAGLLLLFIAPGPNAEVTVTQKAFEYLRSGRPILAMIPEGACRKILEDLREKDIVHPTDKEGIKNRLEDLYKKWKAGRLAAPERKGIEIYERRNLTRRLASLLEGITPEN